MESSIFSKSPDLSDPGHRMSPVEVTSKLLRLDDEITPGYELATVGDHDPSDEQRARKRATDFRGSFPPA